MPIATGLALGLAAIGAAGSVGGAALSSSAAGKAAKTQANAANYAADLQKQEADAALAFQEKQYDTTQSNIAPWLKAGQTGLTQLQALLGLGGNTNTPGYGSLAQGFTAPTLEEAQNEPGYKFAMEQGAEALQNSAAARGNLVSGNTLEALQKYGQRLGETNYNDVYNRAFNTFETNQTNTFNRLAALSGIGQTAANTIAGAGQSAASDVANIDLTTGANIGRDVQNAAAAQASGYVGSANAWSGAFGGMTNNFSNLLLLSQLGGGGGGLNLDPSWLDVGSTPISPAALGLGS